MYQGLSLALIAAFCDETRIIGGNDQLLWHLSEDLKYFKEKTFKHALIMGRKTYDSIGKPLPSRYNIVLTRNWDLKNRNAKDMRYCINIDRSLQAAAEYTQKRNDKKNSNNLDTIFVIGGGEIYRNFIDYADKLYITEVKMNDVQGDTHFPEIIFDDWNKKANPWQKGEDKKTGAIIQYRFVEYTRKIKTQEEADIVQQNELTFS